MSLQPTGHTADGSGLQNHSVSGLYPYIIIHKPYDKTFEVSHRDGITRSAGHASYDEACEAASISKTLDDIVGKRVVLAKRQRVRIAGTVRGISPGATVAVRFDTDSFDTHLSLTDLRVTA